MAITFVETPAGVKLLVHNQLHALALQPVCSKLAWGRQLELSAGRGRDPFKVAGIRLKAKLARLGAASHSGPAPLLTTVHAAKKAARTLLGSNPLVLSLEQLHDNQVVHLQATTAMVEQQNAVGNPNPHTLSFAPQLPLHLGPGVGPVLKPRERLGLKLLAPHLAASAPLKLQLQNFKDWSKLPVVIDRNAGPVKSDRWLDIVKLVMLFLGFIHKFFKVAHPNLQHFCRADFLAAYFSSKGCRGDRGRAIANSVYVAQKVVLFLKHECPHESSSLDRVFVWLCKLPALVKKAWPSVRRGVGQIDRLQVTETVVQLLDILVLQKARVEPLILTVAPLTPVQARFVHDVALACTMFGWLPPLRGKSIRTLCAHWYRGQCQDADCNAEGCAGNRLCVMHDSRLKLVLSHHKAEATWGVVQFFLPADLAALLLVHMDKACKVLTHHLDVDHPFMFMNAEGQPFADSGNFHHYWKALIDSWGGPRLGPHLLRHLFVTQRMLDQGASTPSLEDLGFAFAMGHGHEQWHKSYNLVSLQHSCQQAVDSMPAWRASMLAGRPSVSLVSHAPSVGVSAAALEGQSSAQLPDSHASEDDGGSVRSGVTVTSESSVSWSMADSLQVDLDSDG